MGQLGFTIKTEQDLAGAVEKLGILPLFKNSIPGFSVEENVEPALWFGAEPGPWEWKGPVIRETGCAYGKFLEKKAVFISKDIFPDFANYRRDGYDFDARYEDGLAPFQHKELFDLLDKTAPILSGDLRDKGSYRKDGKKGFETMINRLQGQCYVLISDFVYKKDKNGKPYGWGVAEYSTPERFLGENFKRQVYARPPADSYRQVFAHLKEILPDAGEAMLRKIL